MDEGIRMVFIMLKKRLIKLFRDFDKFDSRISIATYIHVVAKILVSVQYNMK